MGNRPVPSKLKLLTGNPGKRPIKNDEPEPTRGIPEMPEWLLEFPAAVETWEATSEIIDGMGVLTIADGVSLAAYCYLYSQIQQMAHEINVEGRVAYVSKMDSLGNEIMEAKSNPKCNHLDKALSAFRQIEDRFGLNPSSRVRLSVDPNEKKKSKFEGLMNGKKQRKG